MSRILRTIIVFTIVVGLSGIYMGKGLWASSGGSDGGHISHESGGQAVQTKAEVTSERAEAIKDPVCGMEVSDIKKAPSEKYKGKVYYFCSKKCEKAFKKGPAPYTCGCAAKMKGCNCDHCKGKEETCPCPLEEEEGKPHEHTENKGHEDKGGAEHKHE